MRKIFSTLLLGLALTTGAWADDITVDYSAPGHPFKHFWEHMFGSGRAQLSLRESWRGDVKAVQAATDFQYVRFHDILDDDIGLYREVDGKPILNFSYVDQIYDGLLQNHLKPFLELSFMPRDLSVTPPVPFGFWYTPTVSAPKDWSRWEWLVEQLARHLVDRYGIDEVSSWYFEVWNEPNIGFWAGQPQESSYDTLYDHAAAAIKRVSPRLRVGGPSTAQAAWADRFIAHCVAGNIPVDFISTHVYANDSAEDVFGTHEKISRHDMVARAVHKVHDQIKQSARPDLPLIFSEFNASFFNEPNVTDAPYMGPWLATTISQVDGSIDEMSYWSFSDVFDEGGVPDKPFYGGFGLMATGSIPKPAYNVFQVLHKLGTRRVPVDSDSALATRSSHGTAQLALWNYAEPEVTGEARTFSVHVSGLKFHQILAWRVDETHGNAVALWKKMGSPAFPTREQQADLRKAGVLPPPEHLTPPLNVTVPPHGLVLLEFQ